MEHTNPYESPQKPRAGVDLLRFVRRWRFAFFAVLVFAATGVLAVMKVKWQRQQFKANRDAVQKLLEEAKEDLKKAEDKAGSP